MEGQRGTLRSAAAWAALTDAAPSLSPSDLRSRFETLLLDWAGVDDIDALARGGYVDARHLAFIEKFLGDTYTEIRGISVEHSSPTSYDAGAFIEATRVARNLSAAELLGRAVAS